MWFMFDPKAGTDAKCGKPMCCMNTTSMTDDPDKAAGVWGSYTCDLPYWTFQNMLEHIKEMHGKVQYWTEMIAQTVLL